MATILLFLALLVIKPTLLKIKWRDGWLFLSAGILGMLALNVFYNGAIHHLSLSFAAVLLSLAPFFVLFLARIFFKEYVTKYKVFAMLTALIGCILASGIIGKGTSVGYSSLGILFGLGAAFCYGLYTIFSKLLNERNYSVYTILFYSLFLSLLAVLPFTDWTLIADYAEQNPTRHIFFLVLHALCTSILPYLFYTLSFSIANTTTVATVVSGGEPIAALCFGLIFFSEMPTLITLSGVFITIIALVVYCKIDT